MPRTDVLFYQETDGAAPVVEWLQELCRREPRVFAKLSVRINRLAEMGYELRRPEADSLRDGIFELRAERQHVNYRILYFFHGRNVAVLAHSLTKENEIPDADIERALRRKRAFESDPDGHTYYEGES